MLINEKNIKSFIHDYLEGEMSSEKTDELWAYLLGSPDDMDYLETLATLKTMGERDLLTAEDHNIVGAIGRNHSPSNNPFKKYLAVASVLIFSLAVSFSLIEQSDTTGPIAISSIQYDIERSVEQFSEFDEYVSSAIEQSADGNVDEAIAILSTARSNLDLSPNQFYELKIVEGSFLYNAERFNEALLIFESVTEERNQLSFMEYEKSLWFLANTYLQINDQDKARQIMQQVVDLDGAYNRVARNTLESF